MANERAEHIAKVARVAEQARSATVVLDCSYCGRQHASDYICAPSVGMLPHPPSLEKGGCGNSSCEMACNCATKDYFTELEKRRALVRSHQSTTSASGSGLQSAPSLLVGAQQPAHEDGSPSQGGLADVPKAVMMRLMHFQMLWTAGFRMQSTLTSTIKSSRWKVACRTSSLARFQLPWPLVRRTRLLCMEW